MSMDEPSDAIPISEPAADEPVAIEPAHETTPLPEPPPAPMRKPVREVIYRHTVAVRLTHWINLFCITLLLMSGLQIFNAHPRLYWGQYGANTDHAALEMTVGDPAKGQPLGIVRIG